MAKYKPTHKDPVSPHSEKFEKDFNKTMVKTSPELASKVKLGEEVNSMLSEVEQSLKKKIFSLAKMEALVFSDPKLSAVYEEMAENGEEKYGYHYNETIQNMIFNDYVLNSPKYLQKYKMAIPKEKKRRDKSGINQLKKAGAEKMDATGTKLSEPTEKELETGQKNEASVEESTSAGSAAGGSSTYTGYAGPSAWSKKGDLSGDFKGKKKKKQTDPKAKPISTGFALKESNYLTDPSGFEAIFNELNEGSSSYGSSYDGFGSSGSYESPVGFKDDVKNISKELDTEKELKDLEKVRTVKPGEEKRAYGKYLPSGKNVSSAVAAPTENTEVKKPYYKGGKITSPFITGDDKKFTGRIVSKFNQPEKLNEESKSKSQQRLMGMAYAYKKGELDTEPSDSVKKLADSMSEKDLEDFASTKHKGLPEKVDENLGQPDIDYLARLYDLANAGPNYDPAKTERFKQNVVHMNPDELAKVYKTLETIVRQMGYQPEKMGVLNEMLSLHDTVEYVSDRQGEDPFEMHGDRWQFVNARYPDGKIDIGVYRFGQDVVYDYQKWMEAFNINENNIKEDMQSMIDNNGTSMSNKSQATGDMSSEVPMGAQQTSGLNESDEKLFEEINKELEAFSVHHNKLKLMAEEKKTPSMVQGDRLRKENPKNFKKDLQHSGTKEVIDVEKEIQWKDQQTDVGDPQKLGMDIEKQEIKSADMKSGEALKNVGDSTNRPGDEIPKRNLTSSEQEEVDLYRNGQHSLNYDNEPSERFVDRMEADQGELFDVGEKQKEFKADAPTYNKDTQPVEDEQVEKVQFDKNVKKKGDEVAWNERMGLGSNVKLAESMVTGRYIDELGKRRLMEFKLSEVQEFAKKDGEEFATDHLFEMDFTGLGNKYLAKTVDKKVVVNEAVANTLETDSFFTDGNNVFVIQAKAQSLNEGATLEEKPVINEEVDKMKHLLGYKPDAYVDTKNVKKNRGF